MPSAPAMPSVRACTASLVHGIRIRLETKPATSRASTRSLPSPRASEPTEAAPHRLDGTSRGAGLRVEEQHVATGRSDDLGDAAAHLSRPDDENAHDRHARTLPLPRAHSTRDAG